MHSSYDVLVVGAGFAGAVCAERLAAAGRRVLLIDRRPHIAGNAYDELDAHGIRIHRYGPHIFHTNGKRIFEYLSRFTTWRFYEHRVRALLNGALYPIPINRLTINQLYGLQLDEAGVTSFLERVSEPRAPARTSEDVVLSSVGRDLCDKFFRGYTRKQWGLELAELSAGVAARIPVRTNDDDRYFGDSFQFMPADGYTAMFARMLDHSRIDLQLDTEYADMRHRLDVAHTVYTGPIDAFYGYRYGPLPYRSLRFEHRHLEACERYQVVGTVNFPNEHAYTRITEFKHLTGQQCRGTSIVFEFPQSEGDPYYPIPRPENEALYRRYRDLASAETSITFVGRLAEYRYYNMDQVVGSALKAADILLHEVADV